MIRKLRRKFLTEIYRRDVKQYVSELNKQQWDSPEEHKSRQMSKLAEILNHARSVPYYSKYILETNIRSNPLESLKNLPILRKEVVVKNGQYFLHPGVKIRGKGSTSGSTGISLPFYYDNKMLIDSNTYVRFHRSWYGVEPGDRMLKIWGRPLIGIKNKIKHYLSDLIRGSLTLDPWDLTSDNLQKNLLKIKKFKPDFIYGYATSVASLAKEIDKSGLQRDAKYLGLKVIITTAETLFPGDKQRIHEVFDCPVIEEYGAAEVSVIAHECPEGNFHIASDRLLLEFVDDMGKDVEIGEPGHILVTSFVNRVQPLIRYDIGDYGILLPGTCSCGRGTPLMNLTGAKIIEMIKTPSGRVFSAEILDYINLALMRDPEIGISQFRVTQKELKYFIVEIVPDKQFGEHSKAAFSKLFKKRLGELNINLSFEVKSEIERLPGGKLLYFQSELS